MTAGPERDRPGARSSRPVKIAYCDGPRLRRALLAAADYVSAHRAELDRINLFPVADGDTGTNLALTMQSVADAVRPVESGSVGEVAHVAAEASVLGARGNSGMLVAHFLLGFSRSLGRRLRAGTREIADALEAASSSLTRAVDRPVEGTILTVARDTAQAALAGAETRRDLYEWLREVKAAAHRSLQRTREMLPVLREAGVVDAGAKGFVGLLEGTLRYIEGRPLSEGAEPAAGPRPSGRAVGRDEGRYCTQVALRGAEVPGDDELRDRVRDLGTSLLVVRAGQVAKVHIHADDPDAVEARLTGVGEVVSLRVEDTRPDAPARRVAVVTDSSADLPREWAREHGVELVPLEVVIGDTSYRDGEEIGPEDLLAVLRDPDGPVPTTSQAPPGAFAEAFRRCLDRGSEEVLGIFLSGAVSGTLGSARTAARQVDEERIQVVDSRSGSLGLGMLVLRAVELLDEGGGREEVAREVERVRDRSNVLFTVKDLDGLLRSGRVSRGRAWLGNLLGLRPVLKLDPEGHVVPHARARGGAGAKEAIFAAVDEAVAGARRYRIGVVHAGVPDLAGRLAEEVRRRWNPVEVLCEPLTAVISVHTGAGAWGLCYQIEDEGPPERGPDAAGSTGGR